MERLTEKERAWQEDLYWCDYLNPSAQAIDDVYSRLADIEDILGDNYDLDRLRELVNADREGRIAVFPCKPSDVTVYQLRNKKHALGIGVRPRHVGCAKVWGNGKYELLHGGDVPCKDKDFGKTWFLKEDEAQAALEKMNERKEP